MGNLWVSEFCEQAEFVVKTDDDQFVDLYEVNTGLWLAEADHVTSILASDWSKQITWPEYKVYTLAEAQLNSSDYRNNRLMWASVCINFSLNKAW